MPIELYFEPRDKAYRDLIDFTFQKSKKFLFNIHYKYLDNNDIPSLIRELDEYLIEVIPSSRYSHTDYSEGYLYIFECNEFTKSILKNRVNGLFEWLHPKLPEDLSFIDQNEFAWLGTISHERMAWFTELINSEKEYLLHELCLDLYIY